MNAKFTSIEGLRGWMAWWVVAGHALKLVGPTCCSGPITR